MDGANTALLEAAFQRDVEVRRIDADKHVRPQFAEAAGEILADLQQAWQTLKHFHHAHDRQLFHFVPGFAAFGLHQRAGDANKTRVGDLRLERADQTGAENVTGGFSGDQSDSQWTIRHNSANDAAGRTGEEIEVLLHHRLLFGQGFDFRFRFIQRFLAAIQDLVGIADRLHFILVKTATLQADRVDAERRRVVTLSDDKGGTS